MIKYLNKIDFKSQLSAKIKKYKNKKILLYGAGSFFEAINDNFNLSQFDIVGISDKKFDMDFLEDKYLGYKVVKYEDISNTNCDYIFITALKYLPIIDNLNKIYPNKKIEPIVVRPMKEILLEILL